MSPRPLVGIVAYEVSPVRERRSVTLPEQYVSALSDGGALPVVVPIGVPVEGLVARLDGLVLAGGPDVDPARYGAVRDERTGEPAPRRDETEIDLLAAARLIGLPVLAICRGAQVLNVARGGTLHQHLPDLVGHDEHAPAPGVYGPHEVTAVNRTAVASILGSDPLVVPSAHHQAVDRVGEGLVVSARAPDGTIEAVEDPTAPFLIGVQWHPEQGKDPRLFEAFAAAAARYAEAAAGGERREVGRARRSRSA